MRLIDADALTIDLFKKAMDDAFLTGNADMHRLLIQVIAHYPTIDAVPVVRCKDCEWYINNIQKSDGTEDRRYKRSWCEIHRVETHDKGFCHWAYRRKDHETD